MASEDNNTPDDSKGRAEFFIERARCSDHASAAAGFAQAAATFMLAHQVEMLRADALDEGVKLRRTLTDIQKALFH